MSFGPIRRSIVLLVSILAFSVQAYGQNATQPPADQPLLKAEELDALVAPIALYPDTLLAEVLIASTYPLEVVQAERWLRENKQPKGDLKSVVDKQGWDKSVKSLVATPTVLELMSTQLDWTQKLGNAVLAQQPDVMEAVQRLRSKAYDNKKLASTKEQVVTVQQDASRQVIVIEPAAPETIYVPYYDPAVVYGPWPYSDYPPYYWPPSYYIPPAILGTGLAFGAGFVLGRWTSGGNYWGGGMHWGGGNININRPINIDRNRVTHNNWQHNPSHRRGAQYPNRNLEQRFGSKDVARDRARQNLPGRDGNDLKPRANQGNVGDRRPANSNNKALANQNRNKAGNTARAGGPKSASAKAKRTAGNPKAHHRSAQSHQRKHVQSAPRRQSSGGHARSRGHGGGGHRVRRGGGGRRR